MGYSTHIHRGPMVTSLLTRNPALVAKMAAIYFFILPKRHTKTQL
ncbi:MAG: hypothetical protein ACFFAE_14925 [Candidatus Hodarchaeota archaeon]